MDTNIWARIIKPDGRKDKIGQIRLSLQLDTFLSMYWQEQLKETFCQLKDEFFYFSLKPRKENEEKVKAIRK